MDKGAHFLRTDLQVHTPRDPRWAGRGAITDDERKQYAIEFVRACREKTLDAVAITDHHDWEFVPYIREAAKNETDSNGVPIKDGHRLIVFPGMELTLGLPCQALLIFDADFPADSFELIYNKLDIVPSDKSVERIAEVIKLDHVRDMQDMHDKLDQHSFLKGRYIILPNVSDGGNHTILRGGFQSHYKSMPCVGGYTDKGRMGDGTTAIVEGRNAQYGNRAIGVFHTSDCRRRDFSDLGVPSVWIK